MDTVNWCKIEAVCECIATHVDLPFYTDRTVAVAETGPYLRRRASEQGIDSAQIAAGIKRAVEFGHITAEEAKQI